MGGPNLLFLDSGAFSCWSQGVHVDIDQYRQFCVDHPKVTYYVSLDVIPGNPGMTTKRTPELIEACCRQGWKNYIKMVEVLPIEKVIPVYHRGESFKWLEKYLDFGCPYIGIGLSGALGVVTEEKKDWVEDIKKYVFDSAGKPIVKTHGFAVTAWEMMLAMHWYSVDSASWVRQSAYGTIYIPRIKNGEFVYNEAPFLLNVSPKSPSRDERQKHISTLSPMVKDQVKRYLDSIKMTLGEFEVVDVPAGHKRKDGELWWDRTKQGRILKVHETGLATSHQHRFWANMKFIHRANDAIDVDHIYFAGGVGSLKDQIEYRLKRRLLSYHTIQDSKRCLEVLRQWEEQAEQPEPLKV